MQIEVLAAGFQHQRADGAASINLLVQRFGQGVIEACVHENLLLGLGRFVLSGVHSDASQETEKAVKLLVLIRISPDTSLLMPPCLNIFPASAAA